MNRERWRDPLEIGVVLRTHHIEEDALTGSQDRSCSRETFEGCRSVQQTTGGNAICNHEPAGDRAESIKTGMSLQSGIWTVCENIQCSLHDADMSLDTAQNELISSEMHNICIEQI